MPSEVLQAVFCEFQETNASARALCVLVRGSIVIFSCGGSQHSVLLPCKALDTKLWPLPRGLLISTESPNTETKMWGLWNPLDEPQPVKTKLANADLAPFTDPSLKIVFSSADHPFVMLYNSTKRRHSVWAVRVGSVDPASTKELGPLSLSDMKTELVGVILEATWEEESVSPEALSIFVAADESQQPILCIFCAESSQLDAYSFVACGLTHAFSISMRAAAPICALGNSLQVRCLHVI